MRKLLSPTCGQCAREHGYEPVAPWATMHEGTCANCGQPKAVSTADDWKKPGEHVPWWKWD